MRVLLFTSFGDGGLLCESASLDILCRVSRVNFSIVVKCGGVVLRVVVCGVVLVVLCVVLFVAYLRVCVCDLFLFLQKQRADEA